MTFTEFRQKVTSPIVWGNCLGVMIVGLVIIISALVFLDYYTMHDENIRVPNLAGLSKGEAARKLKNLGLQMEVTDTGFVRNKPAGVILVQEIAPGKEVKEGRTINVTINSADSPTITLPDLADNCSLAEAKARLMAIGIKIGPVQYITGEKGWVYEIRLRGRVVTAGSRIPTDEAVTIVVGDGGTDDYDQYGDDPDAGFGDGYNGVDEYDEYFNGSRDNSMSDEDYIIQEITNGR